MPRSGVFADTGINQLSELAEKCKDVELTASSLRMYNVGHSSPLQVHIIGGRCEWLNFTIGIFWPQARALIIRKGTEKILDAVNVAAQDIPEISIDDMH
eukprot:3421831-Amphidinium_carterae.1